MADSPDLPPLSPEPALSKGGTPPSMSSPPSGRSPQSGGGLHRLWTALVRLVILTGGVSFGWLLGVAIAQVLPSGNPEPPLSEVALRQGQQTLRKLRQLPRWWQGDAAPPAVESPPSAALPPTPPAPAPAPLDEAARDRLATRLATLETDLAGLESRLQALEAELALDPSGTVEERLQRLEQRLNPVPTGETIPADEIVPGDAAAAPPAGEAAAPAPAAPVALVPYEEPRFPLVSDRIVLPSALLFEPGTGTLTPAGQQLLDSVVPDLRRYGPATLVVGSHVDNAVAAQQAPQLTLQQAIAVQKHLAPQLEDVRWITVGYGQTRPRTSGTSATDRQRNQRVEIGIVPGR